MNYTKYLRCSKSEYHYFQLTGFEFLNGMFGKKN
jgi:hypothetical protein